MEIVRQYYASKALNNSTLKALETSPWFVRLKQLGKIEVDDDVTHFRIGSAVDCLLTAPEMWEDEFVILDELRPGGLLGKFIEALPAGIGPDSPEDAYKKAYDAAGYKISISTVIKSFWNKEWAVSFYNTLKNTDPNKQILSNKEYAKVLAAVDKIKMSPLVLKYFEEGEDITLHHQLAIYFLYRGVKCKALLDGVRIDHKNKTIQPFDLKTTARNVLFFEGPFIQFGYYRQAAFYTIAIKQWLAEQALFKDYSDYTILPFIFIVAEVKEDSNNPAMIYKCTENDIRAGIEGGKLKQSGKLYRGINDLVDDYKWHVETDQWLYPRHVYETDATLTLDVFENTE